MWVQKCLCRKVLIIMISLKNRKNTTHNSLIIHTLKKTGCTGRLSTFPSAIKTSV